MKETTSIPNLLDCERSSSNSRPKKRQKTLGLLNQLQQKSPRGIQSSIGQSYVPDQMISLASTFPAALAKGLVRPITSGRWMDFSQRMKLARLVFLPKGNDDSLPKCMVFFGFFWLELKRLQAKFEKTHYRQRKRLEFLRGK